MLGAVLPNGLRRQYQQMPAGKFRITAPTVVLVPEGDLNVARTIPKGAIITADSDDFQGSKLVEVTWIEKTIMVFAQDLRLRTEPITESSKLSKRTNVG
jgi:hypothetical protein